MLNLPKLYYTSDDKYKHFNGRPKFSYSQYTSWINPEYRKDYIHTYFLNLSKESNVWADFGSEVGKYIEHYGYNIPPPETKMLSENDIKILSNLVYPEYASYEDEVVIDMGDFVIQGFIDRAVYNENTVDIIDFKTGNITTKKDYYASDEYAQTILYAHGKKLEGYDINFCGVYLLGRKGNGREGHPIRLSGDISTIETVYTEDKAKNILSNMRKAASEISEYYTVFNKINK